MVCLTNLRGWSWIVGVVGGGDGGGHGDGHGDERPLERKEL